MSDARVILGIDLGTTNSLAAVMTPHGPRVLTDAEGRELIPSVVTFLPAQDGEVQEVVGHEAKALATTWPERTIASIKRLMGQSGAEVDAEAQRLAYRVELGPRGLARVRIDDRQLSPEEISARILRKVKDVAEQALGRTITDAVITVPAYFDDAQRQATKDAAQIAGLNALRILNEPTAASLAYGIDGTKDGVVAVYDLGGGTFDVSVLKIQQGVFQVLSTCGDTHLGGDDFDRTIMNLILDRIQKATGARVADRPEILQAVRKSAEGLKIRLSDAEQAALDIEIGGQTPLRIEITRAQFEALIEKDVARTLDACKKALKDAKVKPQDIQEVVLVGGSTRIPMVRRRVAEFFGRAPNTEINPDLAVALGAAIQAGILAGENQSLLLLDVIPLSLGLETMGGAFTKLILRNTTVPCSATEEFSTQVDHQTGVDINIYQGERELVKDCRLLGAFKLRGLPAMPAGLPRVQVTFLINADGVLTVTAKELRSGRSAQIDVVPSHGLTQDEVRNMLMASIDFADQDIQARELLELRNKAQTLVHGTERALELAGPGVVPEQSFTIKRLVKRVKQHVDGTDFPALKAAVEELSGATTQIADDLIGAAVKRALIDKQP